MLDAEDFEHVDDPYFKFKGANRDRKADRKAAKPPMIENGRGLKTVILPLLGKKSRDAGKRK